MDPVSPTAAGTAALKKRTWRYLYEPEHYSVFCNNGGKVNDKHKTAWSEFEGMIWCYECELDMRGFGGIFDGPIPVEVTKMMLGELCFHRLDMVRNKILAPVTRRGKIYYREVKSLTKRMIKGGDAHGQP